MVWSLTQGKSPAASLLLLLSLSLPAHAWDGSQSLEPGLNGPDILLFEDFEAADYGARWRVYSGSYLGAASGTVTAPPAYVFAQARSVYLQASAGAHASSGMGEYVLATPLDAAYLRVYLRLEDGFSLGSCNQLKLFSTRAGATTELTYGLAGTVPTGSDRFNVTLALDTQNALHFYYYHPEQSGNYGDWSYCDTSGTRAKLVAGKWYCLELLLEANSVGQRDGQIAAWVDGVLVGRVDGLRFRDSAAVQIRRVDFLAYFGGSGAINTSPQEQRTFFDNVVLSTQPIGCISSPGRDAGVIDSRADGARPPDRSSHDARDGTLAAGDRSASALGGGCGCGVARPAADATVVVLALLLLCAASWMPTK